MHHRDGGSGRREIESICSCLLLLASSSILLMPTPILAQGVHNLNVHLVHGLCVARVRARPPGPTSWCKPPLLPPVVVRERPLGISLAPLPCFPRSPPAVQPRILLETRTFASMCAARRHRRPGGRGKRDMGAREVLSGRSKGASVRRRSVRVLAPTWRDYGIEH